MRRGVGFVLAGVMAAVLSVATVVVDSPSAHADSLLGYDLSADATGIRIFTILSDASPIPPLPVELPVALPIGSQIQPEMNIPQASAQQASGSGYGLASAAWPGAAVANGGALLGFLVPGFPAEIAALLLYPVRAEARTGQDPPTTKYDIPGLQMQSRADTTSAESDAGAQGLSVLPGTFGTAHVSSSTRATDREATSTARSVVENLNVAGVLGIDSVVSTAIAKSDGTDGSGSATTTITGATVMGQGVTIDQDGIHFGNSSQPLDALVQQVAKTALDAAGIKVTLGPVTNEIEGPSAVVGANSLVITLSQSGYTLGFTLGGARAAAVASNGSDDFTSGDDSDFTGGTDTGGLGGDFSSGDFGGFGDTGTGSSPAVRNPAVDITPAVARVPGHPLSHAAMFFGVLAALLVAVGMRRLNTAVLADPTAGVACTLPGEDGEVP